MIYLYRDNVGKDCVILYITAFQLVKSGNKFKGEWILKRILSFFIGTAAFLGIILPNLKAEAAAPKKIVILGDSIAAGYGLPEDSLSYSEYLAEYYGADVENCAVSGHTTEQLMEVIGTEESEELLTSADMICVSIGGNDVLHIFEDAMTEIMSYASPSAEEGYGFAVPDEEIIQEIIEKYSDELGTAATGAGDNIVLINEQLRTLNPDARIIFQTIYNPFETEDEQLKFSMYALNKFASLYLGTINSAIRQLDSTLTVDVKEKFEGAGSIYTNIDGFDIHPNGAGHMIIAEEIIQTIQETGSSEVFERELPSFLGKMRREDVSELGRLMDGNLRIVSEEATASVQTEPDSAETEETVTVTEQSDEREDKGKESHNQYSVIAAVLAAAAVGLGIILAVKCKKGRL